MLVGGQRISERAGKGGICLWASLWVVKGALREEIGLG